MVGRALKDCSVLQVQEAPWLPTVLTWAGGGGGGGGCRCDDQPAHLFRGIT